MTVHTFTTSSDRKRDAAALLGAYAFTSADKTLPMLMAVRVRWDWETLTMTLAATDRYALGVFKLDVDNDAPAPSAGFEVLLDRADVKRVAQMLKTPTRVRVGVTFTVDTDTGSVEVVDWDASAIRFRTVAADFPRIDTLVPTDLDDGTGEAWGMSPQNLARVGQAVADKFDTPFIIPGTSPVKPVRWVTSIGYGLLMPVRLSGGAHLPHWAPREAVTAAA